MDYMGLCRAVVGGSNPHKKKNQRCAGFRGGVNAPSAHH